MPPCRPGDATASKSPDRRGKTPFAARGRRGGAPPKRAARLSGPPVPKGVEGPTPRNPAHGHGLLYPAIAHGTRPLAPATAKRRAGRKRGPFPRLRAPTATPPGPGFFRLRRGFPLRRDHAGRVPSGGEAGAMARQRPAGLSAASPVGESAGELAGEWAGPGSQPPSASMAHARAGVKPRPSSVRLRTSRGLAPASA